MTNESNPYATPTAAVDSGPPPGVPGGRSGLPFGQGMEWIGRGWQRFTAEPWVWIGMILMMIVIVMVLSLIPLVNFFTHLFSIMLVGGMYQGCRNKDEGQRFEFTSLFSAFNSNAAGQLFLLGLVLAVIMWGGIIIIGLVTMGTSVFTLLGSHNMGMSGAGLSAFLGSIFLFGVLFLVFLLLYSMAALFSTYLVAVHRLPIGEALKQSMQGCWRNMLPLTAYSLVAIVLVLVGIITLGLGMFVVGPLLTAALYEAGKDIYGA